MSPILTEESERLLWGLRLALPTGGKRPLMLDMTELAEALRAIEDAARAPLREALLGLLEHHADVSCISTDADPWPEVCDEADERARAALGDRP